MRQRRLRKKAACKIAAEIGVPVSTASATRSTAIAAEAAVASAGMSSSSASMTTAAWCTPK